MYLVQVQPIGIDALIKMLSILADMMELKDGVH
jgi:hypothetical protein